MSLVMALIECYSNVWHMLIIYYIKNIKNSEKVSK